MKKIGLIFHVLTLCLTKSPKQSLWLALPDEIHLIFSKSHISTFSVSEAPK